MCCKMENLFYQNKNKTLEVSYEKQINILNMAANHFHDTYEIYYLISGKRGYFIKDRTYQINQGNLVFINMYDLHRTLYAGVPNCERIVINFKPSFITTYNKNNIDEILALFNKKMCFIHLPIKEQTFAVDNLFKILNEVKCQNTGFEEMIMSSLIQLLILSTRYIKQYPKLTSINSYSVNDEVAHIVQYINSHYNEPLTLNSISKLFFISPYYFCKLFKEYTSFTFIEYLNNLRIKEAQRQLRELDCNIVEISENVGFNSFSHFGRVFKTFTGTSPMNYRKSFRKKSKKGVY